MTADWLRKLADDAEEQLRYVDPQEQIEAVDMLPDLARLCADQYDDLLKAADTFADLALGLRLLGHTTAAKACDIAESHTRLALARLEALQQKETA